MTMTLSIQILVYMAILAFMAFAWGYSKGHRDGLQLGMYRARSLARLADQAKDANR